MIVIVAGCAGFAILRVSNSIQYFLLDFDDDLDSWDSAGLQILRSTD
jgi:hypothetical protein